MAAIKKRGSDIDLLRLKLFTFYAGENRGHGMRECVPLRLSNPHSIEKEVVTLARRVADEGSSIVLRLFFGHLFEENPAYWALSALSSINDSIVEDRFINFEENVQPFLHSDYEVDKVAQDFSVNPAGPNDSLAIAVFVYYKDPRGIRVMKPRLYTVLVIRLIHERSGGSAERPDADVLYAKARLHPFKEDRLHISQPYNPLDPSSRPLITRKSIENGRTDRERSSRDEPSSSRRPLSESQPGPSNLDRRGSRAFQAQTDVGDLQYDLQQEEREVENLRQRVKEKRELIQRLKERQIRDMNSADGSASSARPPSYTSYRATEQENISTCRYQGQDASDERSEVGSIQAPKTGSFQRHPRTQTQQAVASPSPNPKPRTQVHVVVSDDSDEEVEVGMEVGSSDSDSESDRSLA